MLSIRILFLFSLFFWICQCSRDFDIGPDVDELSREDKLWLQDDDSNGEADSIEKYIGFCDKPVKMCLENAIAAKEYLLTYFDFENVSDNNLPDNSVYGNNALLIEAISTEGVGGSGTAMSFNGISSHALVTNPDFLNIGSHSFSVALWVKTSTLKDDFSYILSRRECISNTCGPNDLSAFNLKIAGMQTYFTMTSENGNSLNLTDSTINISDGFWHHLAGVLDRNNQTLNLYVDGLLKESLPTNVLNEFNDSSSPLTLAGLYSSGPTKLLYPFKGAIDEVRIYGNALSAGAVKDLSNQLKK